MNRKNWLGLIAALLLSACSTTAPIVANNANSAADDRLESVRATQKVDSYQSKKTVVDNDGSLFLGKPFSVSSRDNLPKVLTMKGFVYGVKTPLALTDHLNTLSNQIDVAIYLRNDALLELAGRTNKAVKKQQQQGDSASLSIEGDLAATGKGPLFAMPGFNGSVASFLDSITSRSGLFWGWRNGRIEVYRNSRQTFIVNTDAQVFSQNNSVSSEGSGGIAGAGVTNQSAHEISASRQYDNWGSLKAQVQSALSSSGILSDNPAIGTITIVDTPVNIRRAEALIDNFNRSLEKRIILEMHIIEVTSKIGSNYGVDWNSVLTNATSAFTLNTGNTFAANNILTATITDPSSNLDGSQWLVEALASQGNTSSVRYLSANVQNGIPYPFQDITETHYVASTKTTQNLETTSTEIQTDVITDGVTLFIRPQVTSDGRVLVNFSYTSGTIISLDTVTAGDVSITTPSRHVSSTFASSLISSGQTTLLTGFRQNAAKVQRSGVGHQDAWVLGGRRVDQSDNTEIAILLKATLLD